MTTDVLDRKRSVTRDDIQPATGNVLHVLLGPIDLAATMGIAQQTGLPPRSMFSYARDILLRATPLMDGMWAAAVKKSIQKQVARGFVIEDTKDIATRAKRAQELFELFDGDFESGLQRHLQDFLLCDNGAWVEIARATRGGASRVEGLYHLDSHRVVRTRDPNIPAYYQTLRGTWKPLPADFVANFTDLPSPDVLLNGVGLCAASVAWETVIKMQAIETYFREKVTGQNNRAIHLISGVTDKQLKAGLNSADADAVQKGFIVYKGAVLIPGFDGDKPPTVVTIPLSDIPDGFDLGQERERADAIYSHAAGLFIGDLRPLTGQGLGNGQQARILEESAEGMGLAAWAKQWVTFTKRVNPSSTTFAWSSNDITDRTKQADLQAKQIKNVVDMQTAGFIDTRAGQQLLLDAKVLPKELAPADLTPGGTLTDEDQPSEATAPDGAQLQAMAAAGDRLKAAPLVEPPPELTPDELAAARKLLQEVLGG
jgi:hypothetical protein